MATLRTVTVRSSGGDYTSLSAAEAAEQGDLVALDRQLDIECGALQDTTAVTIDGWTTDSTRYIRIYPQSGAEAKMPYNTSTSYRLEANVGAGGIVLRILENHTRVERIQLKMTASDQDGSFSYTCIQNEATSVRITGCVIRGDLSSWSAGSTVATGIYGGTDVAGSNYYVNNLIHGFDYATHANARGISVDNHTSGKTYVYNNTIAQCGRCIEDGFSDIVAKNNITVPASGGVGYSGSVDTSSNYNASTDSTTTGANSRNAQTFTFVSTGTLDYHLDSGDAGARNFGVDLSADSSFPFSTDFDNATRSGTWDIGADEVTSSATAAPSQAALSFLGRSVTTSAFQNVRIREVLVSGSGQVVGNATDIGLRVWYGGICRGAPDVSLNGMTTDTNGTTSWSIATGTLSFNDAIFYVAQNSVSYSTYTAARMVPSYE